MAARRWCRIASHAAKATLASCSFLYGSTLKSLGYLGIVGIPPSEDKDFSAGFVTQVQGYVHHTSYKPNAGARRSVFVCYSHKDRKWLDRVQVHLKQLVRADLIDQWDDTRLKPGVEWKSEIAKAVSAARIAILLLSPDFLASEFIQEYEVPRLLRKEELGGLRILQLIVQHCHLEPHRRLSGIQALNSRAEPLSSLRRDKAEALLVRLANEVDQSVGSYRNLRQRAHRPEYR